MMNIQDIRAKFPALSRKVYGKDLVYLDNAATSRPKPPGVAAAVAAAMEGFGNCGRGVHDDALSAARTVYTARQKIADLFRCRPEQVCFTPNSTMALNIAIYLIGILPKNESFFTKTLEIKKHLC